jgi:hypothetical protein
MRLVPNTGLSAELLAAGWRLVAVVDAHRHRLRFGSRLRSAQRECCQQSGEQREDNAWFHLAYLRLRRKDYARYAGTG